MSRDIGPFIFSASCSKQLLTVKLKDMPLRLLEIFGENQVELQLSATTQAEAFRELSELMRGHPDMLDLPAFQKEVLARESVSSTCTGNGVAFPHARTDAVRRIIGAIGRSPDGITLDNGQRVQLLVMIGTPKALVNDYLKCLASLAKTLRSQSVRDALLQPTTKAEFLHTLTDHTGAVQP